MIKRKNLIVLTVIFILFIFYIGIDIVMGCFFLKKNDIRIQDPFFHHSLKPQIVTEAEWGGKKYMLITNSMGFKDISKREVLKTSDLKRIMFVGDSFTEGLGYDFGSTFTGIISDSLKGKYEVLNAGVTSYSPVLYFLKTQYFIKLGYKFDKIIVMLDISDIQDEVIYEKYSPENKHRLLQAADIKLSNLSYSYHYFFRKVFKNFLNQSESVSVSAEKQLEEKIENRGSWTYDESIYKDWGEKGLFLAKKNISRLHELCIKNGIKLYIAVYPWPDQILNDSVRSKQVIFWSEFCEMNNIDFIDLFPYFFADSDKNATIGDYFIDGDCHWNEKGHKFIADKILENINLMEENEQKQNN